jgi:outer membrane protein OmpA-like peptidoglycan-associated protein
MRRPTAEDNVTNQSSRIGSVRTALGVSALVLLLGACASSAPTQQLVDARRTFHQAELSSAAKMTPDDLLTARQALDAAERAHKDDPGSNREAHLAYLAERKAQIAMVSGDIASAQELERDAHARYQSQLEQKARTSQSKLQDAQSQLKNAEQGKQDAEARAAAAMASLQEVATVKEEERGTVVTLSGSVLFPTGGETLSDVARQSLDKVAQALQEQPQGSHIRIEGYTDARGSDASNEALSQRRAQAVRDYLAQRGVDGSMLEAVGRGEADPIASNDTPDGRANNRRVEIVIQPGQGQNYANGMGSAPAKTGSTSSSAKSGAQKQPQTQQPQTQQPQTQQPPSPSSTPAVR